MKVPGLQPQGKMRVGCTSRDSALAPRRTIIYVYTDWPRLIGRDLVTGPSYIAPDQKAAGRPCLLRNIMGFFRRTTR